MKKYIYILAAVFLVGILQSCSSYLEENNPNELSTGTFWKDLDDSESNLTSVYSAMLHTYVLSIAEEFTRTDIAYPGRRTRPTGQYLTWYQQRVTSDNRELGDRWDAKYQVIWRANQLIEGLNGMDAEFKSDPEWTRQMAEARFFRGLMHFYLHSNFNEGKIIIRDRIPLTAEEFSKPVSTSEEVIKFFREDLEYAYANLPAQGKTVSRVDAAVAATILGTSHLYQGEHALAIPYFKDVVTNGAYGLSLEQDVDKMFPSSGDFNSESIFEINYADNLRPEDAFFDERSFQNRLARRTAPPGRNLEAKKAFGGQGWVVPSAWLTYQYMQESLEMDPADPRNHINNDLTQPLKNNSIRASKSIALVNDESSMYYGYTSPQAYGFAGTLFSMFKKYTNHLTGTTEFDTNTTPWESGRNVVINRLSGVYLMYAECLAQTDVPAAVDLVNQIRTRWGLLPLDATTFNQASFMDQLMYNEYPLELSLEGFSTRSIDLRRWGVAAQRFQDLSTQVYGYANYTYTKTNGATARRNNSLIQLGSGANQFSEYTEAAAAWAAGYNGYLPLPQSETLNNQNSN
ncbi:RagB/SusD family nutrient uptake outer membrane protein [Polaribacter sp. Z022]|uniref:RagB/SusD family nutrient uptake outer membrane protein n=1 Tax=Polaribacter sp. Z022 TaxID=2927125 RepID=UPI0020222D4B|nr:RagB/SusD family nutrient uptake outer membrane protein [Polaribacter sp. Z022]MCL7754611.1 RagB/SusD family nutrient uptake outer membrane protein [Polaribacter sp. Z022]